MLLETYDWHPFYLETDSAILPIIEASSWLTGRRGIALPFSDFSHPLGSQDEISKLFQQACELGRARKWKYLELRGGIDFLPSAPAVQQFYTHELDLRPGADQLFSNFDSSVRRAIRRAEHLGVSTTLTTDHDALRAFWHLHCQTRRKHGVPPQPYNFMRSIHENLLQKGMGFISLASHQGRPIAAAVFLHFGKQALYKFGASDPASQQLRGANAAFWAGLRHCATEGLASLNFGRTDMQNLGLRRFKQGWGAAETLLSYCRFDPVADRFCAPRQQLGSNISNRVFRSLPIPLLRLAGTLLYRHAA